MPTQEQYSPDIGAAVFSPDGYQKLQSQASGAFYFLSHTYDDILINSKWKIDYVWENGNYYYADGSTVYKKQYNGTTLYSTSLNNPVSIAAIQSVVPMNEDIQETTPQDDGCWVVDNADQKLILMDGVLTSIKEITNFDNPTIMVGSPDGGCYVFDDGTLRIYKVSGDAKIESFLAYAAINLDNSGDIISMDTDINNSLWMVHGYHVKRIGYNNGGIFAGVSRQMIQSLSLGSGFVSSLSVEKSTERDAIYVVGCYNTGSWIAKMDLRANIVGTNKLLSATCPSLVRASQWGESSAIYVVSENEEAYIPDECASSSSSSSSFSSNSSLSSSSSIDSSSSSSSIDSSSSSSSSSIDSSSSSSSNSSSSSS